MSATNTVFGQFPGLGDQGRDNTLGVLVLAFGQRNKQGMAQHHRGDLAVVRAVDKVNLPMPRHGPILDFKRAFIDRGCVLDLAQLYPLLCLLHCRSNGKRAAQTRLQFLFQDPTGLLI